jgi:N-acetylmuramoyl-L-alanine amidase
MRDAFVKAGFPPANYAGVRDGIQTRPDIAAVNLTKVPAVFIEMGNLANPGEAKALAGRDGQVKYAMAITDGILNYVNGNAATGAGPAPSVPTDDASGLSSVIPFVEQLLATEDPEAVARLLMTQGQDVSAQVLKAMLTIVYALFDGKLPIG